MKFIYFLITIFTFISFTVSRSFSQDYGITVNPLIGDTLSKDERDYYKLFPGIEDFQTAVFYLNPDSSLDAKITYLFEGQQRDTIIQNYKKLESLSYHIYARYALDQENPESATYLHPSDYRRGSEVGIYTENGEEITGELLSVRENSLVILKTDCDEDLKNLDCITTSKSSDITKLIVKGNSNLALGIGAGLLVSLISGIAIFSSNYASSDGWLRGMEAMDKSVAPISIVTILSLGLGITLGILTSTPDEVIEPFAKEELGGLSSQSRYPLFEPEKLKKIK
jgi:hypothetical protein